MSIEIVIISSLLFFVIAMLYSSIGHAGASGYLAVMALLSFAPESIKPSSLILNILVASIASYKFIKAGYFDRKLFMVFITTSVPMAFFGGFLALPSGYFKAVAGIFLILSAIFLLGKELIINQPRTIKPLHTPTGLITGSVIGFVSGLVGVGGGIFLSPIAVMAGWASPKIISGVAALFILLNSLAGLAGHAASLRQVPLEIMYWALAVIAGGLFGSFLGIKKFNNRAILVFLSIVLLSAGIKFLFVDSSLF
jgi:uncharacterized protein